MAQPMHKTETAFAQSFCAVSRCASSVSSILISGAELLLSALLFVISICKLLAVPVHIPSESKPLFSSPLPV